MVDALGQHVAISSSNFTSYLCSWPGTHRMLTRYPLKTTLSTQVTSHRGSNLVNANIMGTLGCLQHTHIAPTHKHMLWKRKRNIKRKKIERDIT